MKIPVTREFDKRDPIGVLTLRDDVEIPPDGEFKLAYRIVERASDGTPTKIQVQEISLVVPPTHRKSSED